MFYKISAVVLINNICLLTFSTTLLSNYVLVIMIIKNKLTILLKVRDGRSMGSDVGNL